MLFVLTLFVFIAYLILKLATKNFKYFERQGIKFVKPYPFLGTNTWLLGRENIAIQVKKFYNQFPNEKLFGLFSFHEPFYVIRDPKLIKQLAVKEFENFSNHFSAIDPEHDEVFGSVLTALQDKRWKEMRNALSPIFTSSKMRMMFGLMTEVGQQMSEYFVKQYEQKGSVACDVKDIFSRFTNDVIATCAFGVKVDSFADPGNDFFALGQQFIKFGSNPLQIVRFMMIRYTPLLAKLLNVSLFSKESQSTFYKMIIENMNTREREKIVRPDLINLLMQIRKGHVQQDEAQENVGNDSLAAVNEDASVYGNTTAKKTWTDNEVIAQCLLFFLAGFETASGTLRYLAYELARNPDVQEKLAAEIDEAYESLNGEPMNYEKLQSMKYLDMVISEVLRMWPAAFVTDRLCGKFYVHKDTDGLEFVVDKGMFFWIPIYALHYDPKYFNDPERFYPDRFNEENRRSINFDAYLPFGIGPRNCIGSRFALLEMKIAIYHLLLKFTFDVGPETKIPLQLKKTPNGLQPETDVKLYLKPRNQA